MSEMVSVPVETVKGLIQHLSLSGSWNGVEWAHRIQAILREHERGKEQEKKEK